MHTEELEDLLQRGYRYALSLTHDRDQAQDILQDACLKLSKRGGPWDIRYLIRTIRTCHIDFIRNHKPNLSRPLHEEEADKLGHTNMSIPSFDLNLEEALAQLSTNIRELLYLSVVEGYTAQELATLTNHPRGTILSWLHRAKIQLRRQLQSKGIDSYE